MGLNGLWMGITVSAIIRGLAMFIWYTIYERKLPQIAEMQEESRVSTVVKHEG